MLDRWFVSGSFRFLCPCSIHIYIVTRKQFVFEHKERKCNIMKRKAVSCLLVLAAIMTMTPTIPTLAAENPDNTTQSTQTTTEAGTQNSVVKYDQASAFTVTIPKSIALSSSKSAEYTVKVQGDVIGNEIITVTPDESVILSDSNGKDPVTGDITQEKTEFSSTEVNARSGGYGDWQHISE